MNDIAARSSSGETDVSVDTSVVNSLLVFHKLYDALGAEMFLPNVIYNAVYHITSLAFFYGRF